MKTTKEQVDFAIEFGLKPELERGGMYSDPEDLLRGYEAAAYTQFTKSGDFDLPVFERKYIHLRYLTFREEVLRRLST